MIETEFDEPLPIKIECMLCRQPMTVKWHWVPVLDHWMHATVHEKCLERWQAEGYGRKSKASREIPERFQNFNPALVDPKVLDEVAFSQNSRYKTLAIAGAVGTGKSRIMWAVLKSFFHDLNDWPEYFLFTDLVTDFERAAINRLKIAKYAFIDNIGGVESYGREKALLQGAIHARVQNQRWTFLTIDNMDFDKDFEHLFEARAQVIYMPGPKK